MGYPCGRVAVIAVVSLMAAYCSAAAFASISGRGLEISFVSRKWRGVFQDLTESPKDKLGTVSGLISVLSLLVGHPLAFLK